MRRGLAFFLFWSVLALVGCGGGGDAAPGGSTNATTFDIDIDEAWLTASGVFWDTGSGSFRLDCPDACSGRLATAPGLHPIRDGFTFEFRLESLVVGDGGSVKVAIVDSQGGELASVAIEHPAPVMLATHITYAAFGYESSEVAPESLKGGLFRIRFDPVSGVEISRPPVSEAAGPVRLVRPLPASYPVDGVFVGYEIVVSAEPTGIQGTVTYRDFRAWNL